TGNAGIIQLVRITLVISFQVIIASFIGKFIIKYHAKYIPFQVIAYMSKLFLDFYLSTMLFGIQIGTDEITFSSNISNLLFHNRVILGFLILSVVYLGVAYGVINEARKRRVRNSILAKNRKLNKDIGLMDLDDEDEEDLKNAPAANDAEAQLEKIKSMFDKGLITKEEYDAKRQTIIDKM
ncbi:MAG: SHOCT domain-containing protein, partial [Clostridia bacterium]|nr:SHOCT domain-containing protein [Clostridia bacterium]